MNLEQSKFVKLCITCSRLWCKKNSINKEQIIYLLTGLSKIKRYEKKWFEFLNISSIKNLVNFSSIGVKLEEKEWEEEKNIQKIIIYL